MWDSESLIRFGGLLLLFLAVFCQTGFFFCFFIPSGGLLFTTGVLIATGQFGSSLFLVCGLLVIASLLGNLTGYYFGIKAGPLLYQKEDSRFFKKQHLVTAESFYKKYGSLAVGGGLFFPIIRTFAPIVAGMIHMNIRRFMIYIFIGSVFWISSFVAAGWMVGTLPFLKPYLPYIVAGIILLITIPILIKIARKLNQAGNPPIHKR